MCNGRCNVPVVACLLLQKRYDCFSIYKQAASQTIELGMYLWWEQSCYYRSYLSPDDLWNMLINYTNNRTPEHPNIRESCHSQKGCQIPVTTVPTTWDSTMRKLCNGTTRLKHTWGGIRNWWLMRYMWCFYSVDSPFFGASHDRILMVCNTLIGCCDVGFCTLHSVWI